MAKDKIPALPRPQQRQVLYPRYRYPTLFWDTSKTLEALFVRVWNLFISPSRSLCRPKTAERQPGQLGVKPPNSQTSRGGKALSLRTPKTIIVMESSDKIWHSSLRWSVNGRERVNVTGILVLRTTARTRICGIPSLIPHSGEFCATPGVFFWPLFGYSRAEQLEQDVAKLHSSERETEKAATKSSDPSAQQTNFLGKTGK